MRHLGDITQISGYDAPAVEVVIGGSPCQDLSVAGKREGLSGERSGLFMEQIRIIKEMREHDRENGATYIRPRYMVWENVPGAFSSNKGEDFRIVLEETARVVEPTAVVPRPEKGKWTNAGAIVGDGWSIAWRVFDAQFWGVPQRRRRIALVADFGGATAPEILFERKGMSRNTPPSPTPWKNFAAAIAKRFGGANQTERESGEVVVFNGENVTSPINKSNPKSGDPCHTLNATGAERCFCLQGNGIDRADTAGCNGKRWREDKCYTLNTIGRPAVYNCNDSIELLDDQGGSIMRTESNASKIPTLRAQTHGHVPCVYDATRPGGCNGIITLDRATFNQGKNAQYDFKIDDNGVNSTVTSKGPSAVCSQSTVRRLTPLECERLQGFPDGWTDIGDFYTDTNGKKRKTSDSARYKALGNSIALPSWAWLLGRLNRYCRYHTMASLFDGIGGFPLIWETLNGEGSCIWASEIEEFPIAVTKYHFGEEKQ